jgi:hypothetical protein
MFYNNSKCTKLADQVYIFKNIIPKEIMDSVYKDLSDFERGGPENIWSSNDWYKDKICPPFASTFLAWKFMSELLYPELVIHPITNLMIAQPHDEGMFVHCDSPGPEGQDELYEIDTWSVCCDLQYGIIAYFGNFTGGEVYYPHVNPDGTLKDNSPNWEVTKDLLEEPCLVVQPEAGDIIIHGANRPWDHGTKKTISGTRFAFSNFSLLANDNPGSFYNYKTPEWYEQIGKYDLPTLEVLNEWHTPLKLNPKFADIINEKNSIMKERNNI